MPKAVFIDRDGTVVPDHGYLADAAGIELLPGAGTALRALARGGFLLVLVTNQSGVARRYFTLQAVAEQHRRLEELLRVFGVVFDGVEVCPHLPDAGCDCRKPRPGMLVRAAARLGIDLSRSFMVGDKISDVEAGLAAGCRTVRLGDGGVAPAAAVVPDLTAAAAWILEQDDR
jgi:D-glycero-D-manno-heptose 1,7-bisphosphate phosphatase